METLTLADRKIPQSFGLTINQITQLGELSKQTGKSMSQLAREAVNKFLGDDAKHESTRT
jgi:predicted DNA-binding protein